MAPIVLGELSALRWMEVNGDYCCSERATPFGVAAARFKLFLSRFHAGRFLWPGVQVGEQPSLDTFEGVAKRTWSTRTRSTPFFLPAWVSPHSGQLHWNDHLLRVVGQHRHGQDFWRHRHYDEDVWRLREWYEHELWNGGRLKVHPVHMALPTLGEPQAAADEPAPECRQVLCFPVMIEPVRPTSQTLPQPGVRADPVLALVRLESLD